MNQNDYLGRIISVEQQQKSSKNAESGSTSETTENNMAPGSQSGSSDGGIKIKKAGKRGRKPSKMDSKAKLERSRQSARECRARKKLRYQYLEELVASRERAIYALRSELEAYKNHCKDLDEGKVPKEVQRLIQTHSAARAAKASTASSAPQ